MTRITNCFLEDVVMVLDLFDILYRNKAYF